MDARELVQKLRTPINPKLPTLICSFSGQIPPRSNRGEAASSPPPSPSSKSSNEETLAFGSLPPPPPPSSLFREKQLANWHFHGGRGGGGSGSARWMDREGGGRSYISIKSSLSGGECGSPPPLSINAGGASLFVKNGKEGEEAKQKRREAGAGRGRKLDNERTDGKGETQECSGEGGRGREREREVFLLCHSSFLLLLLS